MAYTPKERFLAAVSHREPDRVPAGEWQFGEEIIRPLLGKNPLFFNGLHTMQAIWDGRRDEVIDEWKKGLVEIVLKLGWDAVLVHLVADKNARVDVPERIDEDRWRYANGAVIRYSRETNRLFTVEGGTAPEGEPEQAGVEPTDSQLEVVRYVKKTLGETHFIFAGLLRNGGSPYRAPVGPVVNEVENWVNLYKDPDEWRDRYLKDLDSPAVEQAFAISRREELDGIASGCGDYGCTTGPFMSPEIFRRAILPVLAKQAEKIHGNGMVFLHHSCGNNQILMDMIVEAGVDVYQSIQPEMDIIKMKKRYGKNIALWGGVSAGDLITSTKDKVYEEARKFLEECKPGGGYIFGTSHSIMPGAKYENYMAMLDALKKYGGYDSRM